MRHLHIGSIKTKTADLKQIYEKAIDPRIRTSRSN